MASTHWEEFYSTHLPPADFEDNRSLLKEFCDRHNELHNPIALVTVRAPKSIVNLSLKLYHIPYTILNRMNVLN